MKKIIYLAMVLVLALSLLAVPALAADGSVNVTVTADKTDVQPGDTVTYTIAVNNTTGSGVAGLEFTVNMPSGLEVAVDEDGEYMVEVPCLGTKSTQFQSAAYNVANALFDGTGCSVQTGIAKESWTVMTLTCKVKDSAAGTQSLSLNVTRVYTSDEEGTTTDLTSAVGSAATVTIPCTNHAWDAGVVTKEATCTAEGVKTFTCANCGETKTEAIAATGHNWDAGVETKAATCTEEGVKTFTCANCGETKTEAIPAKGHTESEEKVDAKDATCTEEGYTGDTVCSECDAVLTKGETIPAKGHTKSETYVPDPETIVPATINTPGTRYVKCAVCEELYPESFEAIWSRNQEATIPASVLEKAGVSTVEELEAKMKPSDTSYTNIQVFEVTVKVDRGDNNEPTAAEGDDFPLTITLGYPESIDVAGNYDKYVYAVTHLKDDGTVEELDYKATAEGLKVTVNSLSPFAISWKDAPVSSSGNSNGSAAKGGNVPNTGDNSAIVLWTVMLGVCAMGAVTVVASKKKTSK
jgi:uncharacterized repeat protein (TIGR01451 family)